MRPWLPAVTYLLSTVPAPTNPDDAIRLVDTVSQRGLVWWLSGLVLFGAVVLYLLIRVIMRNHAQIVAELRKEKTELLETQRKDRQDAEAKATQLHRELLETNRRFVTELQPVIIANTQAQQRAADALEEVEQTMREGVKQIGDDMRGLTQGVEDTHECAKETKEATEQTKRSVETMNQTMRDLMQRPPRNPRQ
jgi:methyl-accepting chemotaxis protein